MTNNTIDTDHTQKRGRGRPKKEQTGGQLKSLEKKKTHIDVSQQRELILHLPISLTSKSGKKNRAKKEDTFSDELDDIDEFGEGQLNDDTMLSVSDTDNINLSGNEEQNDKCKNDNKDEIISKLCDELNYYKSISNMQNEGIKECNYIPLDINLIDNTNGKTIICNKTNIACWWCTYNFDTLPCFIPEKYDDNKYYVFGCFCSCNCAASYNLNMNDYKVYDRYSLIKRLYGQIFGNDINISIVPSREVLEKYGGPMTITEYRKNFSSTSKEYKLVMPSMVPIVPYIEEKSKDKYNVNKNDTNKYDKKSYNSNIFDTFKVK